MISHLLLYYNSEPRIPVPARAFAWALNGLRAGSLRAVLNFSWNLLPLGLGPVVGDDDCSGPREGC